MKLFHLLTRLELRRNLVDIGESPSKYLPKLTDVVFAQGVEIAKGMGYAIPDEGSFEAVEGLGDGTILKKILDFLQSPAGQALIQILLSLLLAL